MARYVEDLRVTLFVINNTFQSFAILGQVTTDGKDVYFFRMGIPPPYF